MTGRNGGIAILDLPANEEIHADAESSATVCDADCIERCRIGDGDAFRRLFDAYKDRVYGFALYTLNGDAASAEDAAQEVFVRVYQNIGRFRGDSELKTWIYRIAANVCTDELRRRKRAAVPCAVVAGPASGGDLGRIELETAVRTALAQLPSEQRAAILLKYFEDLSYDDMAEALDCSKGTIASRLSRGLRALATRLAGYGDGKADRRTEHNGTGSVACGQPGTSDQEPATSNHASPRRAE